MTIEIDDRELLTRFLRGDDDALAALASRYEPAMLGLARSFLRGRADLAADAVQDAWLRAIRSAKTYSGEAGVKTWLYRILINRCHDLRESEARHNTLAENKAHNDPQTPPDSPVLAESDPALQRALESLPEERRTILLLCYHRGMTHEHAAAVLGIPLGTLKSRLHAALKELRTILFAPASQPERLTGSSRGLSESSSDTPGQCTHEMS